MADGDPLDNLIRSTMHEEVAGQEPSAAVRANLLAEAARSTSSLSALGPSVPALVPDLHEHNIVGQPISAASQLPFFSGQSISNQWILLVAPLYAVR
jgi:hypothetical protein